MSIRVAPGADICSDRQPGGTGFLCTLAPGHDGVMHEAHSSRGYVHASWSTTLPRPQVRITGEVIEAFIKEPDVVDDDGDSVAIPSLRAALRAAFEAAGIEVVE